MSRVKGNRLVQVNTLGSAGVYADGRLHVDPAQGRQLGDFVCRYIYDGLGRLARKDTPVNTGLTFLQKKDYYYDGVRRIQEVITRPQEAPTTQPGETLLLPEGEEGNDELPVQLLDGNQPVQPAPQPVPFDGQAPAHESWTDREYVYGPGYVDEFVCQIDKNGGVIYMLQDANYNVVALVSGGCGTGDCGTGGGMGVPPGGTLLEQYTYEPYGAVLIAENFNLDPATGQSRHAVNRVGFQGLFFERFDGDYTSPTIAPGVSGAYQTPGRFYRVDLGRWMQRDMNETALPIITAMAMNGRAVSILMGGFDAQGLYGDGMNLYLFAGANPVNGRDPSGLEQEGLQWLDIDDLSADFIGQIGAFASRVNDTIACGFDWFKYLASAVSCFVPVVNSGVAIYNYSTGNGSLSSVGFAVGSDALYGLKYAGWAFRLLSKSNQARAGYGALGAAGAGALGRGSEALAPGAEYLNLVGKTGTYGELSKLTANANHAIEAHKILEWRLVEGTGTVKMADLPAVILTKEMHVAIGNALYAALPKGRGLSILDHKELIWKAYDTVYREFQHPEWLDLIRRYFQ